MRKLALLIALVAVIGGGAYCFLSVGTNKDVKEALDQALQKLPPGWTAAYKSIDVGVASRQAVLKGVEIHGTGATKLDATIDEVDVTDPALDFSKSWSEAAANPGALAPDKALPVADAIAFKGVTVHVDDQDFRLGSGEVARLRLYPWALLHAGVPSYGEVLAQLQHPAEQPTPQDMLPVLRFGASLILGVGEDSYAFDDASGTAKIAPSGAPPADAAYAIRKLSGSTIDRGQTASATMDGLTVKAASGGDVIVDRVAISGLDARNVLTQALSATAVDPSMADGLTLDRVEYAGVIVKVPEQPPVTLGSVTVSNLAFAHSMLISGEFSVAGFKVTRAQMTDEQAIDAFDKLGLDAATVSFGAGYTWDAGKKTAMLKQANFKIDELGALSLSADMAGIEKADDIMMTATLNHAVLRYDDASFAGRAFKVAATESGADPATFNQQIAGMVQTQSALLGNTPGIKAAGAAVGSFVTDPHNLTIELTPPQPLAIASLDTVKDLPPAQVFDTLGVKVTANQ